MKVDLFDQRNKSQHTQWSVDKIEITLNGTIMGQKIMHQEF